MHELADAAAVLMRLVDLDLSEDEVYSLFGRLAMVPGVVTELAVALDEVEAERLAR